MNVKQELANLVADAVNQLKRTKPENESISGYQVQKDSEEIMSNYSGQDGYFITRQFEIKGYVPDENWVISLKQVYWWQKDLEAGIETFPSKRLKAV